MRKECAQRTRLQRAVNADVASLHAIPVAETVDNVRKQQGLTETSPKRQLSPAGYQRRHGVKEDVATGEALGARRRNLAEESRRYNREWEMRAVGVRVADRVVVLAMGVQQNAPGGKGPDR